MDLESWRDPKDIIVHQKTKPKASSIPLSKTVATIISICLTMHASMQ